MSYTTRTAPVRTQGTIRNDNFPDHRDPASGPRSRRSQTSRSQASEHVSDDAAMVAGTTGMLAIGEELAPTTAFERQLCDLVSHYAQQLAGSPQDPRSESARRNSLAALSETLDVLERYRRLRGDLHVVGSADDAPEMIPHFRDRLIFTNDALPVIRGTSVTVREVVNAVIDGQSWAAIRLARPGLTEEDIRACLAYTTEEEGARA